MRIIILGGVGVIVSVPVRCDLCRVARGICLLLMRRDVAHIARGGDIYLTARLYSGEIPWAAIIFPCVLLSG